AALDDLEGVDRMLVVVLGMLLEPPAPARSDLRVLRKPAQRLLRDLLRHALDRVVRRRHRRAERGATAHLGQIGVELLHRGDHRLRNLEAMISAVKEFQDRKSTRLNSSHVAISYAVFCLKKKMTD